MKTTQGSNQWNQLTEKLSRQFGGDPDLSGILFLIGVQELGKGAGKFSKEEKLDILHVATCKLLSSAGYYSFEKWDKDGWPHYKSIKKLPADPDIRAKILKEAIVEYFEKK